MELHTLHQTVFTGFGYRQLAAFQHIVEGHSCGFSADDRYALDTLRLILLIALLRHGIDTGRQTINLDFTCGIGCDCLVDSVSGHRESDSFHLAVL